MNDEVSRSVILHDAISDGDLELVSLLLEVKVLDVNASDDTSTTPFHHAIKLCLPLMQKFEGSDSGMDEASSLRLKGLFEVMDLLLMHGADVNARDREGSTPLHAAAGMCLLNISDIPTSPKIVIKKLLNRRADVNVSDHKGVMPLHLAAPHDSELTDVLLDAGADADAPDNEGNTALHLAVKNDNLKSIEKLLRIDADANISDLYNNTPLHIATRQGSRETIQLLLESGADPNTPDNDGNTSLHHAVSGGDVKAVLLLAKHGAEVDLVNNREETPMDKATEPKLQQLLSLLARKEKTRLRQKLPYK